MANKIQIRRSTTNSTVTGLANGELAYTSNGTGTAGQGLLYVGDPAGGSPIIIGGKYNFGVLTANQALVTNATSFIDILKTGQLYVSNLYANGSFGSDGYALTCNSSSGLYWKAPGGGGTVTNVAPANGIMTVPNPITAAGNVYVVAGDGIVVNTQGVNIKTTNGLVSNSGGLWVIANTGITVNTSGIFGSAALVANSGIVSNATGVYANLAATSGLSLATGGLAVVATNGLVVNSTGVGANLAATPGLQFSSGGLQTKIANAMYMDASGVGVNTAGFATSGLLANASGLWLAVNSSQFVLTSGGLTHNSTGNVTLQDLYVGGNLLISGALVTINTATLAVNDNMIALAYNQAGGNPFNDLVDSGFYITTGNTQTAYYSGLARLKTPSTNTNPYFQLFSYTGTAPNSTVLPAVTTGTLQSFLAPWGAGGAMVVNSTAMSFVANGSVSLNITANSLSLATALPVSNIAAGTDGQVLQMTGTTVAWSTLDGGTF